MVDLFPLYVAAAALAVAFIWLKFGDKAATALGAVLAAALVYLKLKKGAKTEVENEVLRENQRNDEIRSDARERADDAAERVRVDNATNPERLRDDDGFRRD